MPCGFLGAALPGIFPAGTLGRLTTLPFGEGLEVGLEVDFLKGDLSGMGYHREIRTHFHYSIPHPKPMASPIFVATRGTSCPLGICVKIF